MLGSGYMPGRIGLANVRSADDAPALAGVFTRPPSATNPQPPHSSAAAVKATSSDRLGAGIVVHLGTRHPSTGRRDGRRDCARAARGFSRQSSRPRIGIRILPIFSAVVGAGFPIRRGCGGGRTAIRPLTARSGCGGGAPIIGAGSPIIGGGGGGSTAG